MPKKTPLKRPLKDVDQLEFDEIDRKLVAERILAARHESGLSQRDLEWATAGRLPAQYWSKWENGITAPAAPALFIVAQILGVSADWLLGLEE